MRYPELMRAVNNSYICGEDVGDLRQRLQSDDPIKEMKQIWSGDRLDHIKWLIGLILEPDEELKKEAKQFKTDMGW